MASTFFTRLGNTVRRTFYYAPSNFVVLNHNHHQKGHARPSNLEDNFRRYYGFSKPNPTDSSNSEREVDTDEESLRTGRYTNTTQTSPKPAIKKKQNPLRLLNPFKPLLAVSDTVKYSLGRVVDLGATKDNNLSSPVSRVIKSAIQAVFMPLEITLSAANFLTDEALNLTYKAGLTIKKGVKGFFSSPPTFKRSSYKVASMNMPQAAPKPPAKEGESLKENLSHTDPFILDVLLHRGENEKQTNIPAPAPAEKHPHTLRPGNYAGG